LVAAYDDKQGSDEKEERALIEALGIRAGAINSAIPVHRYPQLDPLRRCKSPCL